MRTTQPPAEQNLIYLLDSMADTAERIKEGIMIDFKPAYHHAANSNTSEGRIISLFQNKDMTGTPVASTTTLSYDKPNIFRKNGMMTLDVRNPTLEQFRESKPIRRLNSLDQNIVTEPEKKPTSALERMVGNLAKYRRLDHVPDNNVISLHDRRQQKLTPTG